MFSIAVLSLFGGYFWGSLRAPVVQETQAIHLLPEPLSLQSVQLRDHADQPFSTEQFHGHWNLVFFGYTGDGSQTPELLTLLSLVYNRLADRPQLQQQTRLVMVTLDPAADTPEKLTPFVTRYGNHFLALTGDPQQIAYLAAQLGVTYKRQTEADDGYRIDHSSSLALIDPAGRLTGLFTGLVDTGSIANDIKQLADRQEK